MGALGLKSNSDKSHSPSKNLRFASFSHPNNIIIGGVIIVGALRMNRPRPSFEIEGLQVPGAEIFLYLLNDFMWIGLFTQFG